MEVHELMVTNVAICRPHDTLDHAARLMWENDCGSVPVVDEKGCVVGMLTDRDICMAAYTRGISLRNGQVSSAMSKELFTCTAEEDLSTAEALMRTHKVRRLPVIGAQGRLAGIISLNDIVREAERERATSAARRVSDTEITQTFGSICEPRVEAATPIAKGFQESHLALSPSSVSDFPVEDRPAVRENVEVPQIREEKEALPTRRQPGGRNPERPGRSTSRD
jgi:CBS domain-containing protein